MSFFGAATPLAQRGWLFRIMGEDIDRLVGFAFAVRSPIEGRLAEVRIAEILGFRIDVCFDRDLRSSEEVGRVSSDPVA
jgi:hypothetical protein